MRCKRWGLLLLAWLSGWTALPGTPVWAQGGSVAAVVERFAKDWPDDRTPYRTPDDTTTWKTYALSMKALVAMGDAAQPDLIKACDDSRAQVRGLAARVLGYLRAESATAKLITLLDDPQATVALHAADALGQIHTDEALAALRTAQQKEKRGDVLLHVAKALDRQVPLEEDVVEQILQLNEQTIDAATIGQPAPDFTLKDSTGKAWKLSDWKGKKSVVLVFIYGDG